MEWLLLAVKRWRRERASTLGLAAVVFAAALVVSALPGLHDRWAETALRSALASAPPASRNLQLSQVGRIEAGGEAALAPVEAVGAALEARLPEAVRALVADRSFFVESPRWLFVDRGSGYRTARLRFQPGIEPHLRLVAGRWPTDRVETTPGWLPTTIELEGSPPPVVLLEVAIGRPAAEVAGVHLGDVVRLELDRSDPLAVTGIGLASRFGQLAVRIVGLFEVVDPSESYWFGDPPLDRPIFRFLSLDEDAADVRVVVAPAAYATYLDATRTQAIPSNLTWRYFIDPRRISVRTVDALLVGLRRLGTVFRDPVGRPTSLRTNLPAIVEREQIAFRSAEVAAALAATGPTVLAIASLATLVLLVVRRRSGSLALWRARGASGWHVVASFVGEGLLVLAPLGLAAGLVVGAILAAGRELPAGGPEPTSDLGLAAGLGLAVAVGTIVLSAVVGLLAFRSLRVGSGRWSSLVSAPRPPSGRRIIFEMAVVGLAIVAAYLVREGGLTGRGIAATEGIAPGGGTAAVGPAGGVNDALAGVDPLLAAVPALLGLAVGLVARRALPFLLKPLVAVAARGRGLPALHAARRLAAAGGHGPILLAVITAATVGGYSAASLARLGGATDAAAWQAVGAPFRVTRPDGVLPEGTNPSGLPGVVGVALASRAGSVIGSLAAPVEVLAVDVSAYRGILAGAPFSAPLPAELETPGPDGLVPALVGEQLARPPDDLAPGKTFALTVADRPVTFRVLQVVPALPATAEDGRFVVVDRVALASLGLQLPTTDVFVAAGPDGAAGLARFVANRPGVVLLARDAEQQRLSEEPIIAGLTAALFGASALGAGFAGVLVVAGLLIVGSSRTLEAGVLEILGLRSRERRLLVLLEFGPLLAAAAGAGIAAGVGLELVLAGGIGLEAAIGRPLPPGLTAQLHGSLAVDPLMIGLAFAESVTIAGVGALWALRAERPLTPTAILRGETE